MARRAKSGLIDVECPLDTTTESAHHHEPAVNTHANAVCHPRTKHNTRAPMKKLLAPMRVMLPKMVSPAATSTSLLAKDEPSSVTYQDLTLQPRPVSDGYCSQTRHSENHPGNCTRVL